MPLLRHSLDSTTGIDSIDSIDSESRPSLLKPQNARHLPASVSDSSKSSRLCDREEAPEPSAFERLASCLARGRRAEFLFSVRMARCEQPSPSTGWGRAKIRQAQQGFKKDAVPERKHNRAYGLCELDAHTRL